MINEHDPHVTPVSLSVGVSGAAPGLSQDLRDTKPLKSPRKERGSTWPAPSSCQVSSPQPCGCSESLGSCLLVGLSTHGHQRPFMCNLSGLIGSVGDESHGNSRRAPGTPCTPSAPGGSTGGPAPSHCCTSSLSCAVRGGQWSRPRTRPPDTDPPALSNRTVGSSQTMQRHPRPDTYVLNCHSIRGRGLLVQFFNLHFEHL